MSLIQLLAQGASAGRRYTDEDFAFEKIVLVLVVVFLMVAITLGSKFLKQRGRKKTTEV